MDTMQTRTKMIGLLLRKHRAALGVSREELYRRTNFSVMTNTDLELGRRGDFRFSTLWDFVEALNTINASFHENKRIAFITIEDVIGAAEAYTQVLINKTQEHGLEGAALDNLFEIFMKEASIEAYARDEYRMKQPELEPAVNPDPTPIPWDSEESLGEAPR